MTSTSKYAGRSTRRYKAQARTFRTRCADQSRPCWLCGKPIDYSLPAAHPESFCVDHAAPISRRPELAEDPANFRPAHRDCNERRGNDDPFIQLGQPSEAW